MSIKNLEYSGLKNQNVVCDNLTVNSTSTFKGGFQFLNKAVANIDVALGVIANDVSNTLGSINITNIPVMSTGDVIEFTINLDSSKFSTYVPDIVFLHNNVNSDDVQNPKLSVFLSEFSAGQFKFILINNTATLYTQSAPLVVQFHSYGNFQ
jgi:hypothetical protein